MAKNKLLMETTKVDAGRTAAEILAELVAHGAKSVNQDYENGKIVGLRWTMRSNGVDLVFDMPARVPAVFRLLQKEYPGRAKEILQASAERIAWRQLLRWVQAQFAMIETGQAQHAEVFMPYIVVDFQNNQRLFERMEKQQFKALPAPTQ